MEQEKYNDLRKLVDKWGDGKTSFQEEQMLKTLLNSDDLPKEFIYLRELFLFLGEEKNMNYQKPLPNRIKSGRPLRRLGWISVPVAAAIIAAAVLLIKPSSRIVSDQTVYGYVNGAPITERAVAEEYLAQALGTLGEQISLAASYIKPLDELNRNLDKLRNVFENTAIKNN